MARFNHPAPLAGLVLALLLSAEAAPAHAYEWDSARNALTAQMQLWKDDQDRMALSRQKACGLAMLPETAPTAELVAPGDVLRGIPTFFEARHQGIERDPLAPTVAAPALKGPVFEERLEDLMKRPWLEADEIEAIDIVLGRSHGTTVSALRWLIDAHIAVMRVGDRQFRARYSYWTELAKQKRGAGGWFWEVAPTECHAYQIRYARNAEWLRWGDRILALYRMLDRASDKEWDGDWGSFPH